MWFREYRDYKIDAPLKKEQTAPGQGLIGCEMHELNGWGEEYHTPISHKKLGIFASLLSSLLAWFGSSQKE